MTPEEGLKAKGIILAPKADIKPAVAPCVMDRGTLYVSGHGPEDDAGNLLFRGRIGQELTIADGYAASRLTAIQLLRSIRGHLGSLDRVERIVKVFGLVNSANDFHDQPRVIDGCSDLLLEIFGPAGRHARSAVGTSNLPMNQPVEIELIVSVRP